MKKCVDCHMVYYCCFQCQVEDRSRHADACLAWKAERQPRARGPDGKLYTRKHWSRAWWT
eukprot:gene13997-10693_t